jgi:hypothetical protein
MPRDDGWLMGALAAQDTYRGDVDFPEPPPTGIRTGVMPRTFEEYLAAATQPRPAPRMREDTLRNQFKAGAMEGVRDWSAVNRPLPGEVGIGVEPDVAQMREEMLTKRAASVPQPEGLGGYVARQVGQGVTSPSNYVAGIPSGALWAVGGGVGAGLAGYGARGTAAEVPAQLAGSVLAPMAAPSVARGLSGLAGRGLDMLPSGALGMGAGGRMIQPTIPREAPGGAMGSLVEPRMILPGETRASTRFPTGVRRTEDPLREHLSIGLQEMQQTPGYMSSIAALDTYPGFARLREMGTDEAARAYVRQGAENLGYLYRRSPEVMKERSPLWYEGAHEISDALARRWGVPRQSSSAALASLSPQMDWFKNASLGERTGDILTGAAAGRILTPEMEGFARQAKFLEKPENLELYRSIVGKRLDQLDDPLEKALWIRLYDEAHNPRAYRTITPEGGFGDFVTNQGGEAAKVGWGALGEIQKAVRALESGGSMDIISPVLGTKHKVRSFYNNIENPNYPFFGDVTADTHQVAAAQMRPLSGASPAVQHNLASGGAAGSMNVPSSDITGVQGTYGLTADATRRMAAEYGLIPRAAQSATWEPVRELFSARFKANPKNTEAVDNVWRAYDRGDISIEQARDAVFDLAGGIGTPSWARPGLRAVAPAQGSTYR